MLFIDFFLVVSLDIKIQVVAKCIDVLSVRDNILSWLDVLVSRQDKRGNCLRIMPVPITKRSERKQKISGYDGYGYGYGYVAIDDPYMVNN